MKTPPADPTLEDLRFASAALQNSLLPHIKDTRLRGKSHAAFKALSLRELLLHRMSSLSTATVRLLDEAHPVPAAIVTRAALETTALLFGLHRALEGHASSANDRALDEFLMKGLVGSRWKDANVQSSSVLTLVDHLDKEFEGFREVYENFCEYTHPNWSGLLGAFGASETEEGLLRLGASPRSDAARATTSVLWMVIQVFRHYYNDMIPNLKKLHVAPT